MDVHTSPFNEQSFITFMKGCVETLVAFLNHEAWFGSEMHGDLEVSKVCFGRALHFCPLCSETLGPWGPFAIGLVTDIGRKLIDVTGKVRSCVFFAPEFDCCYSTGYCCCCSGHFAAGQGFGRSFLCFESCLCYLIVQFCTAFQTIRALHFEVGWLENGLYLLTGMAFHSHIAEPYASPKDYFVTIYRAHLTVSSSCTVFHTTFDLRKKLKIGFNSRYIRFPDKQVVDVSWYFL